MTVTEAIQALQALQAEGHGDHPLRLLSIGDSVVAHDLQFRLHQPYDAQSVLLVTGPVHEMDWVTVMTEDGYIQQAILGVKGCVT